MTRTRRTSRKAGGEATTSEVVELRRRVERQAATIAELNHRLKNTLASVLAIAASSMVGRSSLEGFQRAFEGRVRALSNAHDMLGRGGGREADLRDLIAAELETYRDCRVSIRGPQVTLGASGALALAMIVHELASNAASYGALSAPGGGLSVGWAVADERLILRWIEEGGPPVSSPSERPGFSLRLVERSTANELQGQAVIDFVRTGVRISIDAPLSAIAPSA